MEYSEPNARHGAETTETVCAPHATAGSGAQGLAHADSRPVQAQVQRIPGRRWSERILERASESLLLNLASAWVTLFGSYRTKIAFDLIRRRHYAYGVLEAADHAKACGLDALTVVEFGVSVGNGLLNLCGLARKIGPAAGVGIKVVGFDAGVGMPPPHDYRDHPDLYQAGDFPMDQRRLIEALPPYAKLELGELKDTVPRFARGLNCSAPIGFAAIDVDYYSSAKEALALFADPEPLKYLPLTLLYLDDISLPTHNRWTGELLAVEEFNAAHAMRKIDAHRFLRGSRLFKHAPWIDKIFILHVLDHPVMQPGGARRPSKVYESTF
jgi:hypothetical protein